LVTGTNCANPHYCSFSGEYQVTCSSEETVRSELVGITKLTKSETNNNKLDWAVLYGASKSNEFKNSDSYKICGIGKIFPSISRKVPNRNLKTKLISMLSIHWIIYNCVVQVINVMIPDVGLMILQTSVFELG
jgi:hypothetical protein